MNTRSKLHLLKVFILTIFLWLTGSITVFSQDYLFDTEVIGVEDGLPHRNTYTIVQDKEGFIWVNTLGGISRYDGYDFKTYNHTFLNILESSTARLAVDTNNYLWYCEEAVREGPPHSGVIDTRKDTIYGIASFSKGLLSENDIRYIGNSIANPEDIFIITLSGIVYKYNGSFEEIYRFPGPASLRTIVHCQENPDGSYWIVYNTEAIRVKDKKRLKTVRIDQATRIEHIVSVYPHLIVKANRNAEKTYWTLENDRFVPFSLEGHAPGEITAVFQLHKDYTLYSVKDKLLVRDSQGNIIYSFDTFESLRSGQYLTPEVAFLDRQQILWITTGNGIVKVRSKKNAFKTFFPGNSIRGIHREDNRLWVGSGSENMVRNITEGTQKKFWPEPYITAMSFYKDHRGHLWTGTSTNLLLEYIPDKDTYIPYRFTKGYGLRIFFQNTLTKNYWIGTQKGLYRFDKQTKTVIPFPLPVPATGLSIRQLYQNTKGIWIVSNKGIFLMDGEKETIIKHYTTADGLPGNNINHIYQEKEDVFWLGSKGDGLLRWDLAANTFRQYTRKDGLSNNTIYAVYEDDFETLWLPSNYGLMAFDKNTEDTKVYLPQNGIAHEEFNTHAHFKAEDGTLYFGGLNGVTGFHPKDLKQESPITPPLHLNSVRVLEKDEEAFADNTSDYLQHKKINLNSGDRILEVELTLLDYEKSAENQYAYKIAGHQEQWVYTTDNTLSIINPPYGNYNLIIKARGASGSWSDKMLTIPVHRRPPFYQRWWFIITSALSIVALAFTGVRWRIQRLEKDRKRLEEEVQKRTWQIEKDKIIIEQDKETITAQAESLKALDKAKTRFFSNITHEFRTPLTLVKGPIEQMIAKPPSPVALKKRLGGMLKNTDNLLQLINQLLDISKLEGNQMKVEISHGDIIRYTKELIRQFQPLADKKRLNIHFTTHTKEWKTHFDSDKWHKTLHNLLSNAVKFTPEGGSIIISLEQIQEGQQECIQLQVTDTGIGIEAESLDHIFDRFYQVDGSATRMHEGTGIGLSLVKELVELQNGSITATSTPGKGSVFTVKLPVAEGSTVKDVLPLVFKKPLPLLTDAETWEQSVKTAVTTNGEKERLQLLIIEDNAEMRAYIRSCIDVVTYHISEAANGEQGIAKALETVPDLIISDVMMPEKDGFEVIEAIRNHTATSHIPLILLTAKASLESRLEGLERGADAYLTKPFSPEELVLRIKKLIEIRRLLQARYQNGQLPEVNAVFQKEDSFITELKDYIITHITQSNIGVETISSHFAMSRSQFYRKLKALVNKPIADYIRSVRLAKGMELLKEGQLNITEIAHATGFSSLSHFSRTFKKVYGKSPSEL